MRTSPPPLPILCCGPTPALQRALRFEDWASESDVVRTSRIHLSVGGKATNAARAITCEGGQATLVSFTGGAIGRQIQHLLQQEGLDGVWVDTETETRTCQTLMDGDGKRIRELVEDAGPVKLTEWGELFAKAEQALPFHSGLLLCGSLPAEAPKEVYATLTELAHQAGKPVGVDAKGAELLACLTQEPELLKINRGELKQATGLSDLKKGAHALFKQGVKHILITDGPQPALLVSGRKTLSIPLPSIEPVNPIGGGDTVTGVMFHHLVQGASAKDAASAGLAAGLAQTLDTRPAIFDPQTAQDFQKQLKPRKA